MSAARATLREVAEEAGVSLATVSNVMNGRTARVGAATRERVEAAIARLGYRASDAARSLRLGLRRSIAFLVIDRAPDMLANPYMARLAAGLSRSLAEADFVMTVQSLRPASLADAIPLRRDLVDGLVVHLAGTRPERLAILDRLARLGVPTVLVQEDTAPPEGDFCRVRQDDHAGGRMVAAHLLGTGARRILVAAPRHAGSGVASRLAGFQEGLRACEHPTLLEMLPLADNTAEAAADACAAWFASHDKPDAVFATSDPLAMAAIGAAQRNGLGVPYDLRVVGYNGTGLGRLMVPSLTTVPARAGEVGALAARLLLDRLRDGVFVARDHVLPLTLLPGTSG